MIEEKITRLRKVFLKTMGDVFKEQESMKRLEEVPRRVQLSAYISSVMKIEDLFDDMCKMGISGAEIRGTSTEEIETYRNEMAGVSKELRSKLSSGSIKEVVFLQSQFSLLQRKIIRSVANMLSPKPLYEFSLMTEKPVVKGEIFIVHGKEERQALLLQKYLKSKLKVNAVMFDDLPDKGRTIIEQLEFIRDNVGYAFVIVTPDDVGCLTEDIEQAGMLVAGLKTVTGETVGKIFDLFHTRARQNVVFELGLFIGALGREKVCCLLKQNTEERPSDIDGILYKPFEKSVKEIFHEIPEELKEAGYQIRT